MHKPTRQPLPAPIYSQQSYNTEESIGFVLGRCLNRITDEIDRSIAELGVRAQQFGVLHAVYKAQAKTPSDLARLRFQNSAAIAYTLDVLESRKLVKRTRNSQDRRGVELDLTAEGRAMTKQCIPRVVDAQNRMLGALAATEYETLIDMLLRIATQVDS